MGKPEKLAAKHRRKPRQIKEGVKNYHMESSWTEVNRACTKWLKKRGVYSGSSVMLEGKP